MFEFGKDLRKLFVQARESDDLSWLELVGVDLLAVEARRQATDAGRVSCAHPHAAWLRAAAMWRDHARRSGRADSLERSLAACDDAARQARSLDQTALAAVEKARTLLLRFDLSGDREVLDQAAEAVPGDRAGLRAPQTSVIAGIRACIAARRARLEDDATLGRSGRDAPASTAALMDALDGMESAIRGMTGRPAHDVDDLRLERAGLALEAGILRRDPRLLDQAGRDLQALVASASPDYRPLTRARALTLCGAGLAALASLAGDHAAHQQGRVMFEAAADQFTPDHSPLDWVAIQIVRAGSPGGITLETARHAVALTSGQGLVLGALARDLMLELAVSSAADLGDVATLATLEDGVRRRLSDRTRPASPLDWAVDQMAMARLATAHQRLGAPGVEVSTMALMEAAQVALDHGVPSIARRAESLIAGVSIRA